MKEDFPHLAKEIDFQEVQEVQEAQSPKQGGHKEAHTPKHIKITLAKIKVNERILKAAKGDSYLQRSSHKTISWLLKRNFAGKKGLARSSPSDEKQRPTA